MFLLNEDELDILKLFNEDDDNSPSAETGAAEEFQMDDTETGTTEPDDNSTTEENTQDEEGNSEEETEEEDGEEDNNSEEFQMDDTETNPTEPDDNTPTNDDTGMEDNSEEQTDEDDNETTKKYVLLEEYKELHGTVSKIIMNLELYFNESHNNKTDESMYIYLNTKNLEKKIVFTIINKFEKFDYQKLLKLYYFYQEQLSNIIDLMEKIINKRDKEIT